MAPWDEDSAFSKLEVEHQRLKNALPMHLRLTPRNTNNHITDKTSRNYLLIHALHSLTTVSLYREYMAFLPWNVQVPQGPLDGPRLKDPMPDDRPKYWITQACECFGAAKDFADLLKVCQSANALVETPIAGFATYITAWCGELRGSCAEASALLTLYSSVLPLFPTYGS